MLANYRGHIAELVEGRDDGALVGCSKCGAYVLVLEPGRPAEFAARHQDDGGMGGSESTRRMQFSRTIRVNHINVVKLGSLSSFVF